MKRVAGGRDPKALGLGQQLQTAPFLALVTLEVDQLTKLGFKESLATEQSTRLAPGLHITNVVNPGMVFGISAPPAVSLLLPLAMIVASVVLYWRFERSNSTLLNMGVGLFVGGSLGNVVDRIAYGQVTDFIAFIPSGGSAGTVFNLADVCIILGIVMVELFLIRLVLSKGQTKMYSTPRLIGTRDRLEEGR